jgi:glycosyltransferase involved in cell wall biosynthesis
MKFSIITVCFNAHETIQLCLDSVADQLDVNYQHIIVDGGSSDGTLDILRQYSRSSKYITWISEPDKGIYDAMNKGIKIANGDIVAILNADDFYSSPHTLKEVSKQFYKNSSSDIILTDIVFFSKKHFNIRNISAEWFTPKKLTYGWMPPHPGMFVKRNVYERVGCYDISYQIAADYEFCIRAFLKERTRYTVFKYTSVRMRQGGVSSSGLRSTITITQEIVRACKSNRIDPNYILLIFRLPIKFLLKFISRPN